MRLIKWLVGIVFLVLVLIGITPLMTKWYLLHWLEERGYTAEIKKINVDFIFGEIVVAGVHLKNQQGVGLDLFEGKVELDVAALFNKPLKIKRATLDHLRMDVDRNEQGELVLAGFPVDQFASSIAEEWNLRVGLLQLSNVDICRVSIAQCLRLESSITSQIELTHGTSWLVSHQGPWRASKVFLQDPDGGAALLYSSELVVNTGRWTPERVSLTGLQLQNTQLVEAAADANRAEAALQVQLGEMNLQALNWTTVGAPRVRLGELQLISLRQGIKKGGLPRDVTAVDSLKFWLPSVHALIDNDMSINWNLGSIKLTDGAFSWSDYSVSPAASETVTGLGVTFSGGATDRADEPSELVINGKIGQAGQLTLEGQVSPFKVPQSFAMEGIIQGIQLANLAGYSSDWFGEQVHSGTLDVGYKIRSADDRLMGKTQWRLTQVRVDPGVKSAGVMPLSLSLEVLQDHNLSVPFAIDWNQPLEQLTPRFVFNEVKRTLSRMAAQQVNPAGAVAITPGRKAAGMTFKPLLYPTNTRIPSQEDLLRLDEVVTLLKGKPHLSMVFCPVSTGGEWAELFNDGQPLLGAETEIPQSQREELLVLAKARGRALREELLDRGVEEQQIVICGPSVNLQLTGLSFMTMAL